MSTTESMSPDLKHLGFVRIAAIQTILLVSSLLRSVVGSVEGTAKSVVEPVCEKYKNFPDQVLVFADHKVDEATHLFDKHAPSFAKKAAHHIHILLDAAAEKGRKLFSEVETGGPFAGFQYAVSEFKNISISLIAIIYVAADGFKPFHTLADLVIPTAAHWSEKYNKLVIRMSIKDNNLDLQNIQKTLDKQSQQLNEIKEKIYPAVLTEKRMKDFEEKLEELRSTLKAIIG